MTTRIKTFQDILNALDREPELRRQLRQHFLTEDLLRLPAVIGSPQKGSGTIVQQVESLAVKVARVDETMDRIAEWAAKEEDREYEKWAAFNAHDLLWFSLGIRNAKLIYFCGTNQGLQEIRDMAYLLPSDQQLDRAQHLDLARTDIIMKGTLNGQPTHVVIEASITGGDADVRRVDRRSQLVAKISDIPCIPAIVAATLTERLRGTLSETEAEFPTINADKFNNLPHCGEDSAPEPIRQDILVLPLTPRD